MKTLYLIRHAKSSWANPNQKDINRPLNDRGKNDAPRIGAYLQQKGVAPELLLSSPAKRAKATAYKIAKQLAYSKTDIQIIDALYTFGAPDVVLQTIAQIGTTESSIMVFGHNSTFTLLANRLSGAQHFFDNIPTCGVTCFEFDTDRWETIVQAETRVKLQFYIFPKMLGS